MVVIASVAKQSHKSIHEIATSAFGLLAMTAFFLFVPNTPLLAAVPAMNDVAIDIPVDGGGFLSYTRSWRVMKHLDLGYTAGGGVIQRNFDETSPILGKVNFKTTALVLPYVGPQATLMFDFIGLAVGYGAFYAKTDIDANAAGQAPFSGTTKGWGSGFYSPFLVLNFYDSQHDVVFGVGLGGFLGASYPNLEASNSTTKITTNASPIDSLTVTLRMRWVEGRFGKSHRRPAKDNDF